MHKYVQMRNRKIKQTLFEAPVYLGVQFKYLKDFCEPIQSVRGTKRSNGILVGLPYFKYDIKPS